MTTTAIDPAVRPRTTRLPLLQRFGYACGGLVDGTALHPLNIFLLFYLTNVCGLPGALAGIAIAIGLAVDAVVDPLIGSLSDHSRSRLGRRLPFMLAALVPVAIAFTLLFSLPSGLNQTGLFILLAGASIALRVSVSLFLLPHQALGAELTDDYAERSSIMTLRWALFMIGGVSGIGLGFGVFFTGPEGLMQRDQYTPFALTLSAIILVGGLIAARTAWVTRGREHVAVGPKPSGLVVFRDLGEVFRSKSFRALFFGTLLFFMGFGVNSVLGLHANTYFWGLNAQQTQWVTLALFGGLLIGAPTVGPILRRSEKRTILLVAMVLLLLAQAAPVALRLAGLLPLSGGSLAGFLIACTFLNGAMLAWAAIASAAIMPDAADEHELLFGSRKEGLYFAGIAFANKAASGFGTFIAGLVLQVVVMGPAPGHGEAAQALTANGATLIGLAYGPGAALLSAAALVTLATYRISKDRQADILTQLATRRAANPAL